MRRKIIDDFWLSYLNDLFVIKLIILRYKSYNIATFQIFMDATFFSISLILLKDATDRSKISSDQKRLFFAVSLYPL